MHLWRTAYDPSTRGHRHKVGKGIGHALLAPFATSLFASLRVSAAVWEHGEEWLALHVERDLFHHEFEHDQNTSRSAYNTRCLTQAVRTKKAVRGQHHGYSDLFVPIVIGKRVEGVLVVGPFSRARLSSDEILARWRGLTGTHGRLSDPQFSAYLAAALEVLVLDDGQLRSFREYLSCLTRLMASADDPELLMNRIEALQADLRNARFTEHSWELMRAIVDLRFRRSPHNSVRSNDLHDLGLTRMTDHVLVGLTLFQRQGLDPVEEAVRRDAFQRSATAIARSAGDALAGKVGEYGVVLLTGASGSRKKKQAKALGLCERIANLGKKFGLHVRFGVSAIAPSAALGSGFRAALDAAESAVQSGRSIALADESHALKKPSLRELRRDLASSVETRPDRFHAQFDHYLEMVTSTCGYRVEAMRTHLALGFERIVQELSKSGALDERSLQIMAEELEHSADAAASASEVLAAYRLSAQQVVQALKRPVGARRDRNLHTALEYIHRHYSEPLDRKRVARVAGFAPGYFSELFKNNEGVTFEGYVHKLRIERAKQLLESTRLDVARVAELCGFRSREYFSRAFRAATGAPPLDFRRSLLDVSLRSGKGVRAPD